MHSTPSEDNFMTLKIKGDVLIFTASLPGYQMRDLLTERV